MIEHQPDHISFMNTGHEINRTAILDLHVPLKLSVVRSDHLILRSLSMNSLSRLTEHTRHMRITVLIGRPNFNTFLNQQI